MSSARPDPEQLLAFTLGKLSDEAGGAIAAHLDQCPACEAAAATMDQASDTLVAQVRGPLAPSRIAAEPQCRQGLERVKAMAEQVPVPAEKPHAKNAVEPSLVGRLGEYELLEKLGEGGMGAVYKARHMHLDRIVALKVLPRHRTEDSRAVARFYREMKAVGRVDHPNIVRATDAREIEGKPVLVMEYVVGLDLAELVRRLGSLPVADACEPARQAALGLQCVHENGLVHRDIKPPNLMLAFGGQHSSLGQPFPEGNVVGSAPNPPVLKILDLGLALLQADQPAAEVTASGEAMGTADYMAPEQVTDSHNVDIRADIYALGCTLYKLLTGRVPFSAPEYKSAVEKMMAHLQKPPLPLERLRTDVPKDLVAVVDRMLAKNPADRFLTPAEVAEAMLPFAAGSDLADLMARAASDGPTTTTVTVKSVRTPSQDVPSGSTITASEGLVSPAQKTKAEAALRKAIWVTACVLLAFLLSGVLFQIVIKIYSKDGQLRGTLQLPEDSTAKVERNGKTVAVIPRIGRNENGRQPCRKSVRARGSRAESAPGRSGRGAPFGRVGPVERALYCCAGGRRRASNPPR